MVDRQLPSAAAETKQRSLPDNIHQQSQCTCRHTHYKTEQRLDCQNYYSKTHGSEISPRLCFKDHIEHAFMKGKESNREHQATSSNLCLSSALGTGTINNEKYPGLPNH